MVFEMLCCFNLRSNHIFAMSGFVLFKEANKLENEIFLVL